MKKILTLTILLISTVLFSQENKLIAFQKEFRQVKNQDSLKTFNIEIKNILQSENKNDSIKNTTKWKLLCYTENGWTEVVGRTKTITDAKFVSKNNTIYTTEEVFELFNLKDKDYKILYSVPMIIERENPYNRKTTPIAINNNYLMLRYVHSYPNGNQTSWYHENIYYFKRTE